MADQEGGGDEVALSFMDKVRFMMYGEQEKEAFLIEKKEKEEKKKGESLLPYIRTLSELLLSVLATISLYLQYMYLNRLFLKWKKYIILLVWRREAK